MWLAAVLAVGITGSAVADGAGDQPGPLVRCLGIDGRFIEGHLVGLSPEAVTIGGNPPIRLSCEEQVRVDFVDSRAMHAPRSMLALTNGDRLSFVPESSDGDLIRGLCPLDTSEHAHAIPLEFVHDVWLNAPEVPSLRRTLERTLATGRFADDTLLLRNGDLLTAPLIGLHEGHITLDSASAPVEAATDDVIAIACNRQLSSRPERSEHIFLFELTDGSWVSAHDFRHGTGAVSLAWIGDQRLSVRLQHVRSIRFFGTCVTAISDLEPHSWQHAPWLDGTWPPVTNRSVVHSTLDMGRRQWPRGLGMHSQSEVSWRIERGYQTFLAVVGIDAAAEGGGSVRFAIDADGARIWQSGEVSGADEPHATGPIDVSAVDELTLIVLFGDNGDLLDYANWCDAVLVK